MIRALWATDIHLEFVDRARQYAFYDQVASAAPDCVLLSGDIGVAGNIVTFLGEMDRAFACPILFVLGNHDFYNGSIADVRARVERLALESSNLTYLTRSGVVHLSPAVAVVGHDGWGDARLGDFENSRLSLNDFRLIRELAEVPRSLLRDRLASLGAEAAAHLGRLLPQALAARSRVLVITHVPPFPEVCLNAGRPSDADGLPFFACQAVGDAILRAAEAAPDRQIEVLCGHTHSAAQSAIRNNVTARAGGADYGNPRVECILELP